MAKETFTGPLIALGGVAGGPSGGMPREYSDEIGPSIFWGGMAIPVSGGPGSKDRTGPGAISSVFAAFPIRTINAAIRLATPRSRSRALRSPESRCLRSPPTPSAAPSARL